MRVVGLLPIVMDGYPVGRGAFTAHPGILRRYLASGAPQASHRREVVLSGITDPAALQFW
jgi:hypothetical protein